MTNESKQGVMIWWILWAAGLAGVFVFRHYLGDPAAQAERPPPESAMWLVGFAPFGISAMIRWIILPRVRTAQAAWPLFIIGIALAEATFFLGLFIFPAHTQQLFIASVLGILQFVPYFAHLYFNRDDPPHHA